MDTNSLDGRPRTPDPGVAEGIAPGSVGELVQGFTADGQPFHVTLPASWHARVRASVEPAVRWEAWAPDGRTKMQKAALLTAATVSPTPLRVLLDDHDSPIPVGRGCASSTADVLATVRAVASACGATLDASQQAHLVSRVESSDGLSYPGMSAVNHRTGQLLRTLPWTPRFELVAVLPDRALDTAAVTFTGKPSTGRVYDRLLVELVDACVQRDVRAVADAATTSALLNQLWVHNQLLERLLEQAPAVGALGVAVAHTGTAAAWLFEPGARDVARDAAETLGSDLGQVYRLRVV